MSPFKTLIKIAERCRSFAQELPTQEVVEHNFNGIGFRLDGRNFVSPMEQITEILHEPHCTKIPRVKSWVRGVANVRGKLLPIVNLGELLRLNSITNHHESRVLIVEHENIFAGLIVDAMLGMQTLNIASFSPTVPSLPEVILDFVDGFYVADTSKWIRFNLHDLIQSKIFFDVVTT